MLNRVGARTQPCFTPLMMGKDPERSLFNLSWPCWSLWSWITMMRNFRENPRHSVIILGLFIFTESNALVRSTNAIYNPLFYSLNFSWRCLRTNSTSVVPLLALKPRWAFGTWSLAMVDTNIFRSTRAMIFPAMESRVIPLEQFDFSSLFLYNVTMIASQRSLRSLPCTQQQTRSSWSLICNAGPPSFQSSAWIPSTPTVLPFLKCSMTLVFFVIEDF